MMNARDFGAEHARLLCSMPCEVRGFCDERLAADLASCGLAEQLEAHECDCDYCEAGEEWNLTDAGCAAKAMLRAVPSGFENRRGQVAPRIVQEVA